MYGQSSGQEALNGLVADDAGTLLSEVPMDKVTASAGRLENDVKQQIGSLLSIPADQLDTDVNLVEFGFDSITLTEFGVRLSDFFDVEITPAIFFEYNTIEKLVDYFIENHEAVVKGKYGDPRDEHRVTAASKSELLSGTPSFSIPSEFDCLSGKKSSFHFQGRGEDVAAWLERYPECVPLNHGHGQKPCFWIHPLTGSVEPYMKIAQNVDPSLPFFGIRSKGFGTELSFLDNIPDMARYYIEIISGIDPEGPYQLAGFSMGGVIAQEMARMLQESGKRVQNLLLLEPPFPSPSTYFSSGATQPSGGVMSPDAALSSGVGTSSVSGPSPGENQTMGVTLPSNIEAAQTVDEIAMDPETIITTAHFFLYAHLKKTLDLDRFGAGEAVKSDFGQLAVRPDGGSLKGDALIGHLASCCREAGVRQSVEWIGRTIKNMCYTFACNKRALASHTVLPLPFPEDVDIYYFTQLARNLGQRDVENNDAEKRDIENNDAEKSDSPGKGIREIDGFHHRQVLHQGTQKLLGDALTHDGHHYLKWTHLLPGLHTVRVPSSHHFDFLSDRKGIDAIIEACRSIYTDASNLGQRVSKMQMDREDALHVSRKGPSHRRVDSDFANHPGRDLQKNAVAIVGMSGRFPMAKDLDEFWQRLVEGRDCITEIPRDRWDWEAFYGDPLKAGNKTDVKWGGFMDRIGDFDPMFFGIAPREAEWMDPQQRLLMLYVWKAIEDAGYAASGLAGSRTGLFIGTGDSGYGRRMQSSGQDLEGYYGTATLPAMGPNRMSYFLDFHGPSEPVDTTCSSSLVAICKAVAAIESGSCEAAIAGGVNLIIDPAFHISLDRLGMLSKAGRCRTFSDRADGYVRGEGVGMLFLKSLDAAEAAGDHIYGVIRGCAVNHGGRANSLTAPNPKAQVAVLREAYEKAGIDPATVGYIETHGTGTVLGDPIEIEALKTAFKGLRQGSKSLHLKPHCGLGAVKTNIGHLELAAGVAGVIKVLLQMKHHTIVKSLHCDTLNPHIKLEGSPFYIAKQAEAWEPACAAIPRRAGVSAFGAGGVNAHVVIEEYIERSDAKQGLSREGNGQSLQGPLPGGTKLSLPAMFVLSAKNEVRLRQYALTMANFFAAHLKNSVILNLNDIAYTSQVGRDAMEERLALIVSSVGELRDQLQAFGRGKSGLEGIFCGNVKRDKETLALFTSDEEFGAFIEKWVRQGNYRKLLSLWVKGVDFDWHKLYGRQPQRRISLPTYPFDDTQYGFDGNTVKGKHDQDAMRYQPEHREAQPAASSARDAATALMTFEEYLEEKAIESESASGVRIKNLLCFVGEAENKERVRQTLKKCSPETEVLFLSGSGGETYKEAIADIVHEHGSIDAVMYMTPLEGMAAEKVAVDILYILQAMAAAKLSTPVRFLLAAQFSEGATSCVNDAESLEKIFPISMSGVASCYSDAWIAFERSLPMIMPKMQFGVICKNVQSVGQMNQDDVSTFDPATYERSSNCGDGEPVNADSVEVAGMAIDIPGWIETLWQELHAQKIESAVYKVNNGHVRSSDTTQNENPGTCKDKNFHIKRFVYRNRETIPETTERLESLIQPGKTYLITGGCGGLGGLIARYLARRYGVHLILTGRSPMNEKIERLLDKIRDENPEAKAVYLQGDICDAAAMKREIFQIVNGFGNVAGVIHAAGIQSEGDILNSGHGRSSGTTKDENPGSRNGRDCHTKSVDDFKNVLRPKIEGTLSLDAALEDELLDFVCYFSSASAILGDFGACDYAMANRFMAAYAQYKNKIQTRVKHIAIHWPLWREGGMGFDFDGGAQIYLKSSGQRLLETTEGVELFDRLLACDGTQHLVLAGEPLRVRRFLGIQKSDTGITDSLSSSLSMEMNLKHEGHRGQANQDRSSDKKSVLEAENLASSAENAVSTGRQGRRNEMKGLSVAQCLESDLKTHIGSLLRIDSNQLDADANLSDFGFDSILFAKFAAALTDFYDTEITPSIFFGNPSIERLVHYFLQEHGAMMDSFYAEIEADRNAEKAAASKNENDNRVGEAVYEAPDRSGDQVVEAEGQSRPASSPVSSEASLSDAIAIIGMSGRFPEARNVHEMWEILRAGKEAVSEIPLARFDWRKYYGNTRDDAGPEMVSNRCGILPGVAEFDPAFFEISPKEAGWMDPRQRLLLQESWNALEDAGYGPSGIQKNRMGIFVGLESGDYRTLSRGEKGITSDHEGISAVRLAYFLNFSGPAMAINTACSSGLVAAHQACQSLRVGECDTAIASGVNLLLTSASFISLSKSGMMSPSGKCCGFDKRADGMVPGEAIVSVVLKRLKDAERDNDAIYAVIRGSGINYDGKTNGITAPNQNAQADLLKMVYDRYRIDPEEIAHIVTHGTGTKLGDSIEINALVDAFKGYTDKERFCALTSTKTNFGHSFAASGLVSLVGLVQALRHETIPKSIHFNQENDHIKWSESPFYVNDAAKPWNPGKGNRRLGAVSAFGMSGTNAHMVVESYTGSAKAENRFVDPGYLLVFSAKQQAVLEEKIKDMAVFIENNGHVGTSGPTNQTNSTLSSDENVHLNALQTADLAEICRTLSQGRHHFMYRTAVVVQDVEDAVHVLNQVINHQKSPKIFHGEVPRGFTGQTAIQSYAKEMLAQAAEKKGEKEAYRDLLYALADLYCQGYEIPIGQLVNPDMRSGLRLPTYPFAREHHWVSEIKAPTVAGPKNRTKTDALMTGHQYENPVAPTTDHQYENPVAPTTDHQYESPVAPVTIPSPDQGGTSVRSDSTARITLPSLSGDHFISEEKAVQARPLITLSDTAEPLSGLKPLDNTTSKIALDIRPDVKSGGAEDPICSQTILPGALHKKLRASLAEALYMVDEDIDPEMPFTEMGMDSIIGVEWIKAVNEAFSLSLEAIKIYDYPNLREFAGFVAEKIGSGIVRVDGLNDTGGDCNANITESAGSLKTAENPEPVESIHSLQVQNNSLAHPPHVIETLRQSLAEALYMEERDIDSEMPFTEMGMDSIIGVEWIKAVNEAFDLSLEAIKIYDYPNLREFAGFLTEKIGTGTHRDNSVDDVDRHGDVKMERGEASSSISPTPLSSSASSAPPAASTPPASLEELLEQVQQGILDVDQADQLLLTLQN